MDLYGRARALQLRGTTVAVSSRVERTEQLTRVDGSLTNGVATSPSLIDTAGELLTQARARSRRRPSPAHAIEVWPGQPYPLGATWDGEGTNFSVFSEIAGRLELCLFDEAGRETRVDLPESTAFCWHGYVPGVGPGQRYGFLVHGPWDPGSGQRCNPHKLLLDPYARAVEGDYAWEEAIFGHHFEAPEHRNDHDSAPYVPRSVVAASINEQSRCRWLGRSSPGPLRAA